MIIMMVARHHGGEPRRTDEAQQRLGLVRGVDQKLLAGGGAPQQVGVVVHRTDRDLDDRQPR